MQLYVHCCFHQEVYKILDFTRPFCFFKGSCQFFQESSEKIVLLRVLAYIYKKDLCALWFSNENTKKLKGTMEGWLYIIRHNRIGLQYSRKRYFILDGNCLKSFKSIPSSEADTQV